MNRYSILRDLKEWLDEKETRLPGVLIPARDVLNRIDMLESHYE